MPTVSSELDNLSTEVLEVLAQTRPARNYAATAPVLFARFAIRVTPDNLRAWHVRRVAIDLAERTPQDVRCDIDDYAEAIRVWRTDRRTWATVSRLLAEGFGFTASEQTLRGWWWRRKERGDKAGAAGAAVARGVQGIVFGVPLTSVRQSEFPAAELPAAGSQAPAATSQQIARPTALASIAARLLGETDVQQRIREKRLAQAAQTGIQDQLLARLAASAASAPTGAAATEESS